MRTTYYCVDGKELEYVAGATCELKRWKVPKNTIGGGHIENPVSRGGRVAWFEGDDMAPFCVTSFTATEEPWVFVRVVKYPQRGVRRPPQHSFRFNLVWIGMVPFVGKRQACSHDDDPLEAFPALSADGIDRSAESDDKVTFYVVPRDGSREKGVELYHSDFGIGSARKIDGHLTYVLGPKLANLVHTKHFVEYSVVQHTDTYVKVIPTDEMYIKWWTDAEQWYRLQEPCSVLRGGGSAVKAAFLGKRKGGTLEKWSIPLLSEDAELVVTYKKVRRD